MKNFELWKLRKKNFAILLKNSFLIFALFFTTVLLSCSDDEATKKNYILIYDGSVADPYGVEAVANLVTELGYEVEYISNLNNLSDYLSGAKAFVIGGTQGNTGDILDDLSGVKNDLTDYLENGGRYLGICGGAYIASKGSQWDDGYEEGLSLVDAESFLFDPTYGDSQIIMVSWLGVQRSIYYLNGPAFAEADLPAEAHILAHYSDANNSVAAFVTPYGNGKIALCGPHPEADNTWLIDDPTPLNADSWTPTKDLFLAMLNELLSDSK